jgi:deoxyribodipyrimidine photo-lyase
MTPASTCSALILWIRRDLRLCDHPALQAALDAGRAVIPVYILDPETEALGAAHLWRLEQGLAAFAKSLTAVGSRLILRRGPAVQVLQDLLAQTDAKAVFWQRAYDPASVARDTAVKSALKAGGIEARSFDGHLLFEPWDVETKQGGSFRVYSPFWRAVEARTPGPLIPSPSQIPAPAEWPASDDLHSWALSARMRCGASALAAHHEVGEAAALRKLDVFVDTALANYSSDRDFPGKPACSGLSDHLALGEISPRRGWYAAQRAEADTNAAKGALHFRKELVWREFAYHLMWHSPQMLDQNWRSEWDSFPWQDDPDAPALLAWKQGRTGIPLVDAGLREMYVTGRMHNRARMVVASYLTKHMQTHWRQGLEWFADCLTDWDVASNAMGWQWVAGSGPDAAPYFRIFNPVTQQMKFDGDNAYIHRWIAEGQRHPHPDALRYFEAVPRSWTLSPDAPYPAPIVDLAEGRRAALDLYENRSF